MVVVFITFLQHFLPHQEVFYAKNEQSISLSETGTSTAVPYPKPTALEVASSSLSHSSPKIKKILQAIPKEIILPHLSSPQATASETPLLRPAQTVTPSSSPVAVPVPPLDQDALLAAVVKIECPADDLGSYYSGSGFVLADGSVVTAAHVVMNSKSDRCAIIFPYKQRPIRHLQGTIAGGVAVAKKRHDEEGIDVAVLKLPPIATYPEAKAIFSQYPAVPYPICSSPKVLGDELLHFGYPANYEDQGYLSELQGQAVANADIKSITELLSQDQTYTYKSPVFDYTFDESSLHPYIVSRVASFYGDSGGLAFDRTRQCILGPHRGGTQGRDPGENYSIFINLGWDKAKAVLGSL